MNMTVYFDNSATTRVCAEAIEAMVHAMDENFGNPSSTHALGRAARAMLDKARHSVADAVGARPDEIFFTSGGTEADNWAVLNSAELMRHKGKHIITTAVEHDAILKTAERLRSRGYDITYLIPDPVTGRVSAADVENALRDDTVLVSIMLVNNETGAVNPVKEISDMLKKHNSGAIFHTDAVQAFCKIPVSPKILGADLITLSSHKIHGPKGAGALYIRKGLRLPPLLTGGGQENGLRSGTEAMPGICAMAAAAKEATADFAALDTQVKQINTYLRERLCLLDGVCINTEPDGFLPHIPSIAVPGLRSEILLRFLSERGIYVSAGSACSAKHADNRVLSAFGLPDKIADSTLRLSFSADNTTAECDAFVKALSDAMQTLIHT